jgi:hypothetical protein
MKKVKVEENSANHHLRPEGQEKLVTPLELELTAIENVWLRLTIDNSKVNEYTLSPGNKLMWPAENRFEIIVGNARGIIISFAGKKLSDFGASGESVRLVFTRDGLVEKEKISDILKPKKNNAEIHKKRLELEH